MIEQTTGLVLESDTLSLSTGFGLENSCLVDPIGARHQLDDTALRLIAALATPVRAGDWAAATTSWHDRRADVREILSFMNHVGALQVQRRPLGHLQVAGFRLRCRALGLRTESQTHRWPANVRGGIAATFYAFTPLLALSGLLALLGGLAGLFSGWQPVWLLYFWGLIVLSVFGHEQAHLLALGVANQRAAYIVRGWHYGVLHAKARPGKELTSALAGPLAGAGLALVVGLLTQIVFGSRDAPGIGLFAASFHLLNLLPIFGDGRTIISSVYLWKGAGHGKSQAAATR